MEREQAAIATDLLLLQPLQPTSHIHTKEGHVQVIGENPCTSLQAKI